MTRPQPKHEPITEGFIGMGNGEGHVRGTTELYLPFGYGNFTCEVTDFNIDLKNLRQMSLSCSFIITGEEQEKANLYTEESWKLRSTENLLRNAQPDNVPEKIIVPVFALMLNRFLSVESATLKIDGAEAFVLFDQSVDIVALPDSYPPLAGLPVGESYKYYDKKTTAFYSALELGKKYTLHIELESIAASFEFAPLFPFPKVLFKKVNSTSNGEIGLTILGLVVKPVSGDKWPDWLEYNLNRDIGLLTPSRIKPARPFRGSFPLYDAMEELGTLTEEEFDKVKDKVFIPQANFKDIQLSNYEAIRISTGVMLPPNKDFDIIVKNIKKPLASRIYEQLQTLPGYQDVLVEYDVVNLTEETQNLQFETEISGITDPAIDSATIAGLQNGENRPARTRVAHCPRLKYGILENIVNPEKMTLHCKVTNKKDGKVIFENTYPIDLLPHDQMIWEIRDVRNSNTYNLADFICAWVHPNDKEGLLDKARTEAVKYHPDKLFQQPTSLADTEKIVKAIYEYLSTDLKLKYVSQPFTSKSVSSSQRVILPETSLKNKAGNCIDLTVLFASILEGFGIYSIIFITEDHAFIGWGNPRRTKEMFFLETTVIDSATFEQAKQIAEKTFREKFLFVGAEDPMAELMSATSGRHIIDLAKVRTTGIVSKR